jgi:hypothetical protein
MQRASFTPTLFAGPQPNVVVAARMPPISSSVTAVTKTAATVFFD